MTTNSSASSSGGTSLDALKQDLLRQRDVELGTLLKDGILKMIAAHFEQLRQQIRDWPQIERMSEAEGMQAVQKIIADACFNEIDISVYSASQIEAAKQIAEHDVCLRLPSWRQESSLDAWLESE